MATSKKRKANAEAKRRAAENAARKAKLQWMAVIAVAVIVNFYADWCIACRNELPTFSTVSAELRDELHFVHVNSREEGPWRKMPEEFGTDWWPIARDINGTRANGSGLWQTLDGNVMPITAFYDAGGRLVYTEHGGMTENSLRAVLAREFGIV